MKKQIKSNINEVTEKRYQIGERIRKARLNNGYTQQKVADELTKKLGDNSSKKDTISAQSVSYWENGNFLPSSENLILLSEVLGVSVSSLVEDRAYEYEMKKQFFDIEKTYKHVLDYACNNKMKNTLNALPFMRKAHEGVCRDNSNIPYIIHPLNMACHLLAMGINDDVIIAATLLHDVVEDTEYRLNDLPVDDEVKQLVKLLTHDQKVSFKKYCEILGENPKASLIKLVDRCNNLTTMTWGKSHEKIHESIIETEKYVLPLLRKIKNGIYDDAAYLLSYQMQSTLDVYKRLI